MRRYLLTIMAIMYVLCAMADGGDRYVSNSVLSEGTWVKIRVEKAGVYQLTNSNLRSMGFPNPEKVKLYGIDEEVLPETGLETMADDLQEIPLYRTGDKVLFYARGLTRWTLNSASNDQCQFTHTNNPYSNYKYYLLTEGDDPKEFATFSYKVGSSATNTSTYPTYSLIESDGFSYMSSGRQFFDSYDYANGNSKNYTLDLPGLASGSKPVLEVQFCAGGSTSSSLTISANGSDVGVLSFSALGNYEKGRLRNGKYVMSSSMEESNSIRLVHQRASGVAGHLDYIRCSYIRSLSMTDNQLLFRPSQDGDLVFQLSGANENTIVWRITKGCDVEGVDGSLNGNVLSIPFTSEKTTTLTWKNEELVALNPTATYPTPSVVGKIDNQDLHSLSNIDYVIVVPSSGKLLHQAKRLADIHNEKDGFAYALVTADMIYNEFSGGTPDATALRRFMKFLWDTASTEMSRPKDLLLFGDGVWDNRMVTFNSKSMSPDDYLLCYESDNSLSETESYVLEEYYGLVDDKTPTNILSAYPRIGVGRIPVTSAAEAQKVVDKLIRYINNEEVGAWKNTLCFVCDDGNNNIHMEDGESIIRQTETLHPSYHIRRIYLDTYQREVTSVGNRYPGTETDVNKQMQDGALIMNYTGHGGPGGMTHEQVILREDFDRWNSPRMPLWVTAACDIAPFDMNIANVGETAILNPDGAAMGIVATTRTVYPGPNRQMNLRFMKYVLGSDNYNRRYTLGEALALAKSELVSTGSSPTNRAHFVLLGDPAITLATPTYNVVIDAINGKPVSETSATDVGIGEEVTVSGHIEAPNGLLSDSFGGIVYSTIMDNKELVVCNNNPLDEGNGNDSDEPYTFKARMRTLYKVAGRVDEGKFTFKFPIPLDNNYSGEEGLISLYATDDDGQIEAHGQSEQFKITDTRTAVENDGEGPTISPIYLNSSQFQSGDVVNECPLLIATITDKDGINMTGSGIGHDITAMIDNNEATTYSLNGYFLPATNDYTSGDVTFSIPALSDGYHQLTIRAFDILNNPSTATVDFYVNNGAKPKIYELRVNSPVRDIAYFTIDNDRPQTDLTVDLRVYSISGQELYHTHETHFNSSSSYTFSWNLNGSNSHLTPGVYIVKAGISTSEGPQATAAAKFIVLRSTE